MSWNRPWGAVALLMAFLCEPSVAQAETVPVSIVAFGDSLTAGLGVSPQESYPAQLQRRLTERGYPTAVINAGVSGDTSAGGLRRVPWVLKSHPDLVILELGANDGLRGLNLTQTADNLDQIIRQLLQGGAKVVLAGMKLPPNYGAQYREGFERIFPTLARRHGLPFIPFFLEGVAASATLNQADGIHPTGEGYRVIVDHVVKTLEPLLASGSLSKEKRAPEGHPPAPSQGSDRRMESPTIN